jgi:hypothetical protein
MSGVSTAAKTAENEELKDEQAGETAVQEAAAAGAADAVAVERNDALPPFAELLQQVTAETGKGYGALMRDMFRCCLGGNKLTTEEYFNLRLYDDAYSKEQKAAFAGIAKSRNIWTRIYKNSRTVGTIIDKLAGEALFRGAGFPVVRTLGACNLKRELPGLAAIDGKTALEAFLTVHAGQKLFGKPTGLSQSLGSMAIDRFDAASGTVRLAGGKTMPVGELWDLIEANFKDGYLFQERLSVHPDLAKVCGDKTATVRMLVIEQDGEPEILGTAWKIPAGDNVADNFWRPGNMLASVDADTGTVVEAIQGLGIKRKTVFAHPDSNEAIAGLKLPDWDKAKALVLSASRLLHDTWMIGWDVAFTPDGPVIVEANETPDLLLMQFVPGEGILTPRFKAFLDWVDAKNDEIRKAASQKASDNNRSEASRLLGGATKF